MPVASEILRDNTMSQIKFTSTAAHNQCSVPTTANTSSLQFAGGEGSGFQDPLAAGGRHGQAAPLLVGKDFFSPRINVFY